MCYCERTTQIFVTINLPQAMPRVLPSQRRRHWLLCLFFGRKREVVIFYDKAMCRQLETGRRRYPCCQAPCHCVLPESMSVVTTIVTAIVLNSSEHIIAVENYLFSSIILLVLFLSLSIFFSHFLVCVCICIWTPFISTPVQYDNAYIELENMVRCASE